MQTAAAGNQLSLWAFALLDALIVTFTRQQQHATVNLRLAHPA